MDKVIKVLTFSTSNRPSQSMWFDASDNLTATIFSFQAPKNRAGWVGKEDMGVEPKIGGKPPKWMVKIMENPIKIIKIHDLGGFTTPIFGNTHTEAMRKG